MSEERIREVRKAWEAIGHPKYEDTEVKVVRESIGFEKIKKEALKEILRGKINKIEFKEIKDDILGVLYMVCEFSLNGEILSRGISVRSLLDSFSKKKGKNKAFGRSVKALLSKSNSYPVRVATKPVTPVNRVFTYKNDSEKHKFLKLQPFLDKCHVNNKECKIYYKINPSLPLALVNEFVRFKSEYKPDPVEFEGLLSHES